MDIWGKSLKKRRELWTKVKKSKNQIIYWTSVSPKNTEWKLGHASSTVRWLKIEIKKSKKKLKINKFWRQMVILFLKRIMIFFYHRWRTSAWMREWPVATTILDSGGADVKITRTIFPTVITKNTFLLTSRSRVLMIDLYDCATVYYYKMRFLTFHTTNHLIRKWKTLKHILYS